jgi:hypothetical protein
MTPTMREVRLRDLLAAVEEWRRASDEDRRYWRRRAQLAIADFRHFHLDPEAAAFRAAVARIRMRRAA